MQNGTVIFNKPPEAVGYLTKQVTALKRMATADMKNSITHPIKWLQPRDLTIWKGNRVESIPYAILSWRNNRDDLTVFFQFSRETWKIIYTTNLIENLNVEIRKYTKSKISFHSDDAVKKTDYLPLMEIKKKCSQPIHNWSLIMNQFMLMLENGIQN